MVLKQSQIDWTRYMDGLRGKADRDLSNLDIITNCVLDIPQDISLVLTNGAITLKAGSTAYLPNGVDKFTKVTCTKDISYKPTWGAGYSSFITGWIDGQGDLKGIGMCRADLAFSGPAAPPATINGTLWYDTNKNKVAVWRDNQWKYDTTDEPRTLFLGKLTVGEGNNITSIDQVFNGFGYIGSTIFVVPGVKVLIPDGRYPDGRLKNTQYITDTVKVGDISAFSTKTSISLLLSSKGNIIGRDMTRTLAGPLSDRPEVLESTASYCYYATDVNKIFDTKGSTTANWQEVNWCFFGKADLDKGNVVDMFARQPFYATDHNELDGRWNRVVKKILNVTAQGTYELDISQYLPKDGSLFEIILFSHISRSDTSGSNSICRVYSDFGDKNAYWYYLEADGANFQQASICSNILTSRGYLKIVLDKQDCNSCYTYLQAVRKVR